jgi:hypothetical protein
MDLHRWRIGSFNARAQEGILDAVEATWMNLSNGEKAMFGMIGFCLFVWLFGSSAKPDPTQCDIPTGSTELIAQVQSVQEHIADANKTIDSTPSPSDRPHEAIKRKILVYLAPKGQKCPPCEQWKALEMKRFMDANWDVAIFNEPHSYPTPTFEIESGGKKATIKGYTTLEQAAEAVR